VTGVRLLEESDKTLDWKRFTLMVDGKPKGVAMAEHRSRPVIRSALAHSWGLSGTSKEEPGHQLLPRAASSLVPDPLIEEQTGKRSTSGDAMSCPLGWNITEPRKTVRRAGLHRGVLSVAVDRRCGGMMKIKAGGVGFAEKSTAKI
jgi:hypothetical protein